MYHAFLFHFIFYQTMSTKTWAERCAVVQFSFPWSLNIRCARTETGFRHSCFGGKSESQGHGRRGSCHPSPECQADSVQVLPIPAPQLCPFMHRENHRLESFPFSGSLGALAKDLFPQAVIEHLGSYQNTSLLTLACFLQKFLTPALGLKTWR